MQSMRTTVDLPETVHRRAQALARARNTSLSAMLAELTVRGLASLEVPVTLETDPVSGFPVLSLGRTVTSEQVAHLLDDE